VISPLPELMYNYFCAKFSPIEEKSAGLVVLSRAFLTKSDGNLAKNNCALSSGRGLTEMILRKE